MVHRTEEPHQITPRIMDAEAHFPPHRRRLPLCSHRLGRSTRPRRGPAPNHQTLPPRLRARRLHRHRRGVPAHQPRHLPPRRLPPRTSPRHQPQPRRRLRQELAVLAAHLPDHHLLLRQSDRGSHRLSTQCAGRTKRSDGVCDLLQHYRHGYEDAGEEVWDV